MIFADLHLLLHSLLSDDIIISGHGTYFNYSYKIEDNCYYFVYNKMSAPLNEFDVLKRNLPLKDNINNYLCVKTILNNYSDLEFRMASGLDKMIHKFGHSGWTEMKPLVVGIKCYTKDGGFVYVRHENRDRTECEIIDSFETKNEEWYTFKYPLLDNYHTETRIILSEGISAYTLAVLNTSERVRYDHNTNYFPAGYASFEKNLYGEYNKAIIYRDEKGEFINMGSAYLDNAIIVDLID